MAHFGESTPERIARDAADQLATALLGAGFALYMAVTSHIDNDFVRWVANLVTLGGASSWASCCRAACRG